MIASRKYFIFPHSSFSENFLPNLSFTFFNIYMSHALPLAPPLTKFKWVDWTPDGSQVKIVISIPDSFSTSRNYLNSSILSSRYFVAKMMSEDFPRWSMPTLHKTILCFWSFVLRDFRNFTVACLGEIQV